MECFLKIFFMLVAGCWQITIVCGVLLTPLFSKKIPVKSLLISLIIIFGVFLIQYEHATSISLSGALLSIIPIIIAAFSYPLGNRKIMEICRGELDTFQRIYGMTLCSLPFWITLSVLGEFLILKGSSPNKIGLLGLFLIILGMVINSTLSSKEKDTLIN